MRKIISVLLVCVVSLSILVVPAVAETKIGYAPDYRVYVIIPQVSLRKSQSRANDTVVKKLNWADEVNIVWIDDEWTYIEYTEVAENGEKIEYEGYVPTGFIGQGFKIYLNTLTPFYNHLGGRKSELGSLCAERVSEEVLVLNSNSYYEKEEWWYVINASGRCGWIKKIDTNFNYVASDPSPYEFDPGCEEPEGGWG